MNPEGNASLLEENAAALSEIARLEASLRDQGKEFQIREREMRDKMGEQKAELDDLSKSANDLAGERARLVAAVRDAQTEKGLMKRHSGPRRGLAGT